ncbi:MAG: HEPN domain-containing protein [Nitrososphaerales archaeon]
MVKSNTRSTRIGAERNFFLKAEDFLEGAKEAVDDHSNASAALAVHAVISACDAICAKFLQRRHAGSDHMQAVEMLNELPIDKDEVRPKVRQGSRVLSKKNLAEYEDRIIGSDEAQSMIRDAERFLAWVRAKIE